MWSTPQSIAGIMLFPPPPMPKAHWYHQSKRQDKGHFGLLRFFPVCWLMKWATHPRKSGVDLMGSPGITWSWGLQSLAHRVGPTEGIGDVSHSKRCSVCFSKFGNRYKSNITDQLGCLSCFPMKGHFQSIVCWQ